MEFVKSKYFFWGLFAGLLWTSFGVLILLFFLSEFPLEESILKLYKKQKLGGVISLAALVNLPIFFIALRKNKFDFAAGLVAISLILVFVIGVLKINF